MQAFSGTGYPGVPSLDSLSNMVPHIPEKQQKIEEETCKILESLTPDNTAIINTDIAVSATCNRVPVIDGHTECVSVSFKRAHSVTLENAENTFKSCAPDLLHYNSVPNVVISVLDKPDHPQPRLDCKAGNGLTVSVGRIRPCPVLQIKFILLSHNTILGAAASSILNAEYAISQQLI